MGLLNNIESAKERQKYYDALEYFKDPGVLRGIPPDKLDDFVNRIEINFDDSPLSSEKRKMKKIYAMKNIHEELHQILPLKCENYF